MTTRTHSRVLARRAIACSLALVLVGCASWQGARLYQSGTRALESGDTEAALADLRAAARLVPDASEVQNHLGLAWLANGDELRALDAFERAVELDCDNAAAQTNLERLEAALRDRATDRVSSQRVSPPAPR